MSYEEENYKQKRVKKKKYMGNYLEIRKEMTKEKPKEKEANLWERKYMRK